MLKNIGKKIKSIATIVGTLGIIYASQTAINYKIWNMEFIKGDYYHSVTKADGAYGHTRFARYNFEGSKKDEVLQFRPFGLTRIIVDEASDGLVDEIDMIYPLFINHRILVREKDYECFKDEFDRADGILAETKERFAKYF